MYAISEDLHVAHYLPRQQQYIGLQPKELWGKNAQKCPKCLAINYFLTNFEGPRDRASSSQVTL